MKSTAASNDNNKHAHRERAAAAFRMTEETT
jgi:hypothetical protein